MPSPILISVIIPLPDHRGMAVESIKRWRQNQIYPQDRFEVLVISDGSDPGLENEIKPYLHSQDSLLIKLGNNIPALTNFGAENALGDLLFITESHCLPKSDCLTQIAHYFDTHNVDVACCSSDGINQNLLAEMEQRIFDEDFAKRSREDGWNKITVRGFAIKRKVFLDIGGFESQYGHFSEPVLGATLHSLGYRMGYASQAQVSHYNNFHLKYLIPSLVEYGEDEIRYRMNGNQEYCRQYFSSCLAWEERDANSMMTTRQRYFVELKDGVMAGFQKEIKKKPKIQPINLLIKKVPYIILGHRWSKLKHLSVIELSKIQLLFERENSENYFQLYKRLWRHAIEYGHHKAIQKYLNS